jgi:hypothetical protein
VSLSVRLFAWSSLAALLVASLLHLMLLLGWTQLWPALIHLLLFGWITAIILAVNYHTLPVFSGRNFPIVRLPLAHWAVWAGGITLAVAGMIGQWRWAITSGLLFQLGAALLFVANTLLLFLRGSRRPHAPPPHPDQPGIDRLGTHATKSAGLCLPLALLLLLAADQRWIDGAWVLAAEHLTTLGWILLMIAGVAYHVLPRFSGQSLRGSRWVRLHLSCHIAAVLLMVPALALGWTTLFALGAALLAAALSVFAWTLWPTLVVLRPRPTPIALSFKERPR